MKNSILFKLNILFTIALITTLIAGFSIIFHISKRDLVDMMYKSRIVSKEIRESREIPIKLLQEFQLTQVPQKGIANIIKNSKYHQKYKKPKHPHRRHKRHHTFVYKGNIYIEINDHNIKILLKDKRGIQDRFALPIFIFLGIIILLFVMYILLRRSLKPIKLLEKDIIDYGNGIFPNYKISTKKDEISLVSNAFYQAIEKSKTLIVSRQLFVRNIFHELNTPITKGKILAEITEDKKSKDMLESIFNRLSSLLQQLAQMEQITSRDYNLNKKEIRVIELIDQARDWLYMDKDIDTNIRDEVVDVDFHLMSIVFKNLIDNAQKYGKNLKIIYQNGSISFISKGQKLEQDLSYYTQAFAKGETTNSSKGFGLGLYIVYEILQKHQISLEYEYVDGDNVFRVG